MLFQIRRKTCCPKQQRRHCEERSDEAISSGKLLALPTRAMEREASAAGLFETPFEKVPKIQIITLAELFQGKRPRIPRIDASATFRAAARERSETQGQLGL